MSINWQNIRPWNGSQYSAFEELCCQLARCDQVPPGAHFVRKGTPDAGIECYWQLPAGDEWGWQAKFFLSPPEEIQWRQIDESVKTAIEKHPRLTRLTVCFPIDRSDPHVEKQKWFMDKWNEHAAKWNNWVSVRQMSVEFDYWGEHEIWERLGREEHRGKHFFWFNKEALSKEWFESRIDEAVANVGPRYTPELNVKLPIARLFEGLGRTTEFFNQIKTSYGKISRASKKALSKKVESVARGEFNSLNST